MWTHASESKYSILSDFFLLSIIILRFSPAVEYNNSSFFLLPNGLSLHGCTMISLSIYLLGFPGGTMVKNLPGSAGDTGDESSIPGSGRSPGGGHGHPLLDSCLENPMDRGAWWATVHGVAQSGIQLSMHALNSQLMDI